MASKHKRVTVEIVYDQDARNPREDYAFGTLAAWTYGAGSRRDWIGDDGEERGTNPHTQLRGVSCVVFVDVPRSMTDRYWAEGILYVTRDQMRAEYGDGWRSHILEAGDRLKADADEWRNWADGHVFGFQSITETLCPCCDQWAPVDNDDESCYGFITDDPTVDLGPWIGEHLSTDTARDALAAALANWDGAYPVAAKATLCVVEG
jgi:hypothetical protein